MPLTIRVFMCNYKIGRAVEWNSTARSLVCVRLQFKASTGHSPLAYFNLLKIQEACRLLDHTSMKLNQVCYKLRIDDPYYFSRLFKKIMGMSPRAYRILQKV